MNIDTLLEMSRTNSDMMDHIFTLYSWTVGIKPKIIFEIGVNTGNSTISFLTGLKELDSRGERVGQLYSIDVNSYPNTEQKIDGYGLTKYWNFEVADSLEYYKKWDKEIDILYIDGDHTINYVRNDFYNYSKFVKKGGYIFLHDSFLSHDLVQGDVYHVYKFLPELKNIYGLEILNLPYCCGLTLIRKI